MQIPLSKLKATLLYLANNTNEQYLGKIKLMKLLYLLDFTHVKKYGTPITGDTYYNLEKGPIPTVIMNMVDQLATNQEESKLSDTIIVENPPGTAMQKIVPLRDFTKDDKDLFSPSEIEVLKQVTAQFADMSTPDIIEYSHQLEPWKRTDYREEIPYSLAGYDKDSSYTPEEIQTINNL